MMLIICILLCCKNIFLEYHHVTDAGYSNYSEAQNDWSYQDRGLSFLTENLSGCILCLTLAPSVFLSHAHFVANLPNWGWKADKPDGLSFSGSDLSCHWWYTLAHGPCASAQMGTETWKGHKTFSSSNPGIKKKKKGSMSNGIKAYFHTEHNKRVWVPLSLFFSDEFWIGHQINLMRSSQEIITYHLTEWEPMAGFCITVWDSESIWL